MAFQHGAETSYLGNSTFPSGEPDYVCLKAKNVVQQIFTKVYKHLDRDMNINLCNNEAMVQKYHSILGIFKDIVLEFDLAYNQLLATHSREKRCLTILLRRGRNCVLARLEILLAQLDALSDRGEDTCNPDVAARSCELA